MESKSEFFDIESKSDVFKSESYPHTYNKAINIAMLRAWEYCNVARKRTDDLSASLAGLDFY
jgi:hypothetical protein